MILKRWRLVASVFMVTSLLITAPVVSEESYRDFRQQNGLQAYVPPEWFLRRYFIANEKNPGYVFGPVQEFVGALDGTTTWLIEDLELERLEAASADGKKIEYSLFLEACLKRLHTDYIDLLFVHGIRGIDDMDPRLESWSRAMKTQGGGPVQSDSESEIKMAGRFMQKGFTHHQAKLMAVWEDKRIACICSQMPNLTIMATNAVAAVDQTRLSSSDRALLAQLDFSAAQRSCPRSLPIGRMMQEATKLLA